MITRRNVEIPPERQTEATNRSDKTEATTGKTRIRRLDEIKNLPFILRGLFLLKNKQNQKRLLQK
jgi:hypothetical protein